MEEKQQVITDKQKRAVLIIKELLNEMHKDINELMNFENLKVGSEKIEEKAIRISKIAIALQKVLISKMVVQLPLTLIICTNIFVLLLRELWIIMTIHT